MKHATISSQSSRWSDKQSKTQIFKKIKKQQRKLFSFFFYSHKPTLHSGFRCTALSWSAADISWWTQTHTHTLGISVKVWWNQHCWFVIWLVRRERLPNSHWYGCHGKSTGLTCCHSWSGSEIRSNASTCKEWITPVICQHIHHSRTYHVLSFLQ